MVFGMGEIGGQILKIISLPTSREVGSGIHVSLPFSREVGARVHCTFPTSREVGSGVHFSLLGKREIPLFYSFPFSPGVGATGALYFSHFSGSGRKGCILLFSLLEKWEVGLTSHFSRSGKSNEF